MGVPVYVLGESGTGKSASLRNFKPEDVKVINVASKPLPFKNKLECVSVDTYDAILREIKNAKQPSIVVDDAQYIMANEFMRRATERGYDKFTEIAFHMWDIVNEVKSLASDKIVYFMSHLERDADGNEKVKTIGKLLDEKITLEGMFTIVLKTNVSDGQYSFLTQNSGKDTVKSPIGMFDSYAIDNDLKYVDEKIRNYYELGTFLTDEEIAEIDKIAKTVELEPKCRRGRGRGTNVPDQPSVPPMPAPRKSRAEVKAENQAKINEYMEKCDEAVDAIADGREELPFDEASEARESVEKPDLEALPRKTAEERKTRKKRTAEPEETPAEDAAPAEESAPVRRRRRSN